MISLRIQRILSFIPYLNALVLFLWLYNFGKSRKGPKVLFKSLLVAWGAALPWVILLIVLSKIIPDGAVLPAINLAYSYLVLLSVATGLIWYQKKIFGDLV